MESTTLKDKIKKPYKRNDGFAVKCIRGLRDIKQIELAEKIGVSEHTMYKLEKTEEIKEPTLSKIAEALNVDVETITNFSTDCTIEVHNNTFNNDSEMVNLPGNFIKGVPMEDYNKLIDKYVQAEKEISTLKEQLKNKS